MIFGLNDLEVLKQNDSYEFNEYVKRPLNTKCYMSIVATNKCQKKCPYCINSHTDCTSELDLDKALPNIKAAHEKLGINECVILGGEPTLHTQIVKLVSELHKMSFNKVVMTTNGVDLTDELLEQLLNAGLTHLNVSVHNDMGEHCTIGLNKMRHIYETAKRVNPNVPVRINTNVWKGNHDTLDGLIDWLTLLQPMSDTIRVSNLIKKDGFSVNSENNEQTFDMMHTDEYYNELFDGVINHYAKNYSLINNPSALGFVDYTMIPTKSAIIINRNIDSKVAEQVCENEETKINTVKCLINGELSLSWNTNNIFTLKD